MADWKEEMRARQPGGEFFLFPGERIPTREEFIERQKAIEEIRAREGVRFRVSPQEARRRAREAAEAEASATAAARRAREAAEEQAQLEAERMAAAEAIAKARRAEEIERMRRPPVPIGTVVIPPEIPEEEFERLPEDERKRIEEMRERAEAAALARRLAAAEAEVPVRRTPAEDARRAATVPAESLRVTQRFVSQEITDPEAVGRKPLTAAASLPPEMRGEVPMGTLVGVAPPPMEVAALQERADEKAREISSRVEEGRIAEARRIFRRLGPVEQAAVAASVLLTERGFELIGAAAATREIPTVARVERPPFVKIEPVKPPKIVTKGVEAVLVERIAEERARPGETWEQSFARGITEAIRSPVIEAELAFAAPIVAGRAITALRPTRFGKAVSSLLTVKPTEARFLGLSAKAAKTAAEKATIAKIEKVSRALSVSLGGAAVGVKGVRVAQALEAGRPEAAIGEILTGIAEVPLFLAGAGIAKKKFVQSALEAEIKTKTPAVQAKIKRFQGIIENVETRTAPKVTKLNLKGMKRIPTKARNPIKQFFRGSDDVIGGSVSARSQGLARSFADSDIDVFTKIDPRQRARELARVLTNAGVERVSIPPKNPGEVTIAGQKAVEFHVWEKLVNNIETVTSVWKPVSTQITKTPGGIRIQKSFSFAQRKAIAGIIQRADIKGDKDISDFFKVVNTLNEGARTGRISKVTGDFTTIKGAREFVGAPRVAPARVAEMPSLAPSMKDISLPSMPSIIPTPRAIPSIIPTARRPPAAPSLMPTGREIAGLGIIPRRPRIPREPVRIEPLLPRMPPSIIPIKRPPVKAPPFIPPPRRLRAPPYRPPIRKRPPPIFKPMVFWRPEIEKPVKKKKRKPIMFLPGLKIRPVARPQDVARLALRPMREFEKMFAVYPKRGKQFDLSRLLGPKKRKSKKRRR